MKMNKCKIILGFMGSLIGPLNIGIYFLVGGLIHGNSFYQKLSGLHFLKMWTGFWIYLLFIPCLMGTALTLFFFWRDLLNAKTNRDHIIWGILFGAIATVCSTGFLILSGIIFNYLKGIETAKVDLAGIGYAISGTLALGLVFIILFLPMIVLSGSLFGLVAKALKERFAPSL